MAINLGVEVIDECGDVRLQQLGDRAHPLGIVVGPADIVLEFLEAAIEVFWIHGFLGQNTADGIDFRSPQDSGSPGSSRNSRPEAPA
jgi:hypothetical protein